MNERFYELAVRAKIQMVSEPRLQEFAELIVKECCAITDEAERADLPVLASKFVKAHFGVE
jgi:hypothetical protein